MKRELNNLERIGFQALLDQASLAQQQVNAAVRELGFDPSSARFDGSVLTDEEPDAQPNSTDN